MHPTKLLSPVGLVIFITCNSCYESPTVSFQFDPAENPESLERIKFTNESLDALYYYWDFGNGKTSEEESPSTRYPVPGDYKVKLVAENKHRSSSIEETIVINPPTLLDIYFFSIEEAPLFGATVQLFTSYYLAINGIEPLDTKNTDANGLVTFSNLEPYTYFVYMQKQGINGVYRAGGTVGPCVQNEIVTYYAIVEELIEKKSAMLNFSPAVALKEMN
jgi:hypothetical protein